MRNMKGKTRDDDDKFEATNGATTVAAKIGRFSEIGFQHVFRSFCDLDSQNLPALIPVS